VSKAPPAAPQNSQNVIFCAVKSQNVNFAQNRRRNSRFAWGTQKLFVLKNHFCDFCALLGQFAYRFGDFLLKITSPVKTDGRYFRLFITR